MKEIADRGLWIAESPNAERGTRNAELPNEPVRAQAPQQTHHRLTPSAATSSAIPHSAFRIPHSIELHIEELIIVGFAPDNREQFAAAVESELARLLGERGIAGSLTESIEVEHLAGGALRIRQDEKSETIGRQLARAIYTGMIGGLR